jgi:hypothetical protein
MEATKAGMGEVGRAGAEAPVARPSDPHDAPFRTLAALGTLATAAFAVWLVFVIAFVLPARDPAHVPLWRGIAGGLLAFSALSAAYLARVPRRGGLERSVIVCSCAAIAAGLYGIVAMARAGAHFEGYIVLMGAILCGHGLTLLAHAAATARSRRRPRIG